MLIGQIEAFLMTYAATFRGDNQPGKLLYSTSLLMYVQGDFSGHGLGRTVLGLWSAVLKQSLQSSMYMHIHRILFWLGM